MSDIQTREAVPGLSIATKINNDLKKIGIEDVELMFDTQIRMWAAVQVFKPSGRILLMNTEAYNDTKPIIMFWIKHNDGTARIPSHRDFTDIIAIVHRGRKIFEGGPKAAEKMIDDIEAAEQKKYDDNRKKQSERIRSVAKPLKKLMKEM